jgi:hypothetical protein
MGCVQTEPQPNGQIRGRVEKLGELKHTTSQARTATLHQRSGSSNAAAY